MEKRNHALGFPPEWRPLGSCLVGKRIFFSLPCVRAVVPDGCFCVVWVFLCGFAAQRGRCRKIAKPQGPRVNEEITARTCRLIGEDGSQLGLFGVSDALRLADERGLDLVEIAPNAEPPVCKVMDYRKFKYEQDRKAKAARKNQAKVEVKEMKFRPKIDVGDYETKKSHVLRFLKKGARVKITIMFRGREMAHPEQGLNVLERLAEDLKPFANVEAQPKMEGRNMHMLVAPIKGAFDEKPMVDDDSANTKEN